MKNFILVSIFALVSTTSMAFDLTPGVYLSHCERNADRGALGFSLANANVVNDGVTLTVSLSVNNFACKKVGDSVQLVRTEFGAYDSVLALDWSRLFKIPGQAGQINSVSTGLGQASINLLIDGELLTSRQVNRLNDGKTISKTITFHYGHGSAASDLTDVNTFDRSIGYYEAKIEFAKINQKLTSKLISFGRTK